MKNMTFAILVGMVVLAGCSTPRQVTTVDQIEDLRLQAEQCLGEVKFQATVSNGRQRARYTCTWDDEVELW
jgi:uncharacterized lipoprotein YajG